MATLTRDQILNRALDMVAAPSLNNNDRPAGTILSTALSVQWLADAINIFAEEFPWAQALASASISIPPSASVTLPADFILDVRDGITIAQNQPGGPLRLRRLSFQKYLDRQVMVPGTGVPTRYVVVPPVVRFWRTPDATYSATLNYYQRPTTLSAGSVPVFPTDLPLIEYVRLRGLEWVRAVDAGSALKYAQQQIADIRKSGLAHEPEDDTIPFDRDQFIPAGDPNYTTAWLGPFSNQI